jgi:hypothetical protein
MWTTTATHLKTGGRNQPTESHIYTGVEHHDGTNMDRNQGIVTQSGEQIKSHKKQVQSDQCTPQAATKSSRTRSKHNLTSALHKWRTNQAAQEARYKIEKL